MALEFPPGFSEAYRLPVISAEATARIELLENLAPIPIARNLSAYIDSFEVKPVVVQYLCAVAGAFAEQACLAVEHRRLSIAVLDPMVEAFVELALTQAYWGLDNKKIKAAWKSDVRFRDVLRPEVMAGAWHSDHLNRVPKLAAVVAGPAQESDSSETRGARRRSVVDPKLKSLGLSQAKWATKAGLDPSVAYDYLKGTSKPTPKSRNALAHALGLKEPDLPQ